MILSRFAKPLACALLAMFAFPGAAAPAGSSLYLRIPKVRQAPAVATLSYDAVATVPQRPNTPAALLPEDQVEGTLTLPASSATAQVSPSDFRRASSFTVVEVAAKGFVLQRTAFSGITILGIDLVPASEGTTVQRVHFRARSVNVSAQPST